MIDDCASPYLVQAKAETLHLARIVRLSHNGGGLRFEPGSWSFDR